MSTRFHAVLKERDLLALRSPEMRAKLDLSDALSSVWTAIVDTVEHAFLDPAIMPIVALYWGSLEAQSQGMLRPLPDAFVAGNQRYFSVDLRSIRYAEGIDTLIKDTAITIGYHIFFPRSVNVTRLDSDDAWWVYHELTHCEQYAHCGGVADFFHKYVPQVAAAIIKNRTFNVHDSVPLEAAANARADALRRIHTLLLRRVATPRPGVFYYIIAKHSGQGLNVYGSSTAPEERIIQWPIEGNDNEKWRLVDAGDGYFNILAKHSGQGLNVYGSSIAPEERIIQWPIEGNDNEKWAFVPV